MCTLVMLRRPGHRWPVLIAANRDEMLDRTWDRPGEHWPDRPGVVAGRDRLAGGSWLGINKAGVVAAILNRTDSLGPAADKRSRGELVLEALDHNDAADAADALSAIAPEAYRTFNLVIADNRDAYWLSSRDGHSPIAVTEIPAGLSMITSTDLNDTRNFRIATYLPQFREAAEPDPDKSDWSAWQELLRQRHSHPDAGPSGAMCIVTDYGYGTGSSSLIALASPEAIEAEKCKNIWMFAEGCPDRELHEPVRLPF
jgi:uncharacterized protein with NRDE domain